MNQTIAYKYRGGVERDLESLENNYFWAPNHIKLNDPCETLVSLERIKRQIDNLEKSFRLNKISSGTLQAALDNLMDRRSKVGIYSLSTSFDHELLWAHYANSHKGFCIQYDLNVLINQNIYQELHFFPVVYKKELPSIKIEDISKSKDYLLQKMFGTKSKLWDYEAEVRIITDIIGENDYDYSAVTAIYFGYRMLEEHKNEIMNRLQGRCIEYYQMDLEDNSYRFKAKPVKDAYENTQPYLFQVKKNQAISYEIIKKEYHLYAKKGTIDIKLESKISKEQLKSIAFHLKRKIFRNAERVFMLYYLPDMGSENGAWATTNFESNQFDIKINGFTIEQEEKIVKIFSSDMRDIIGRWLDTSPFISAGLTLVKEKSRFFLESIYRDGGKQTEEVIPSKINGGVRYDDIAENPHGEYFIVDSQGTLHYFAPEGKFKELKPYLQK